MRLRVEAAKPSLATVHEVAMARMEVASSDDAARASMAETSNSRTHPTPIEYSRTPPESGCAACAATTPGAMPYRSGCAVWGLGCVVWGLGVAG